MNDIGKSQNEPKQLQRLAAQRRLYSCAKRIFGLQLILAGPIAVAWACAALAAPRIKGIAAAWGLLVSMSDVLWLTPWQRRLRVYAAKIQEAFDCDVLQLPWNEIKIGKPVDPELVKEQADRYHRVAHRFTPLRDWYPTIVSELPLAIGRVICQRSNCWWDAKQRRRYASWIIGSVAFVTLLILGAGFAGGMTTNRLFVAVVMPLSPAIIVAVRQFTEQREAANRLDALKEHAEQLWSGLCEGDTSESLSLRRRALQDEIFENRKRSPLVFDTIFRMLRSKYEEQMNHGARDLAEQAKKKLGLL